MCDYIAYLACLVENPDTTGTGKRDLFILSVK